MQSSAQQPGDETDRSPHFQGQRARVTYSMFFVRTAHLVQGTLLPRNCYRTSETSRTRAEENVNLFPADIYPTGHRNLSLSHLSLLLSSPQHRVGHKACEVDAVGSLSPASGGAGTKHSADPLVRQNGALLLSALQT